MSRPTLSLPVLLLAGLLAHGAHAATFTVDTADQDLAGGDSNEDADPGDPACATAMGACTLRAAIQQANAGTGRDIIAFAMAVDTIELSADLPPITDEVDITGRLVGGAPDILIDGGGLYRAFQFEATAADDDGSSLGGLIIINTSSHGVALDGAPYILDSLWIGVDRGGNAAGNSGSGIVVLSTEPSGLPLPDLSALGVDPSDLASLGVPAFQAVAGADNVSAITNSVIGGNDEDGVLITGQNTGGVILAGNRIGTNPDGDAPRGNGQGTTGGRSGVRIADGAHFNAVIGNVISANGSGGDGEGVLLAAGAVLWPNLVGGNTVGLPDPTNAPALFPAAEWGNAGSGVRIESFPAPGNPAQVAAIVSGNLVGRNRCGRLDSDSDGSLDDESPDGDAGGIAITNGAGASDRSIVVANLVGVAEFPPGGGILDLGNLCHGINVSDGSHIIGGANAADANAIGANQGHGLVLRNTTTNGSVVKGNRIGRDVTNNLTFGNAGHGIFLSNSGGNTIGWEEGDAPLFGPNVIAGNAGHGIKVEGANAFGNLLRRNRIWGVPDGFLGIDLDRDNATPDVADPIDDDNGIDATLYSNWAQNTAEICAAGGGGFCAGASSPAYSGGNTSVQWTLFSFRNASFRVDFYAIGDDDAQWLHEELVTTDENGRPLSGGACDAAGLCTSSFPSDPTNGMQLMLTATRIDEDIVDVPPLDGDMSDEGPVNNTSEFSVPASIPDQVQFSAADYPVAEGDGLVTLVTVTRSGSGEGAASVDVLVEAGTAGAADFTATSPQPLAWADGETGDRSVAITLLDDAAYEGSEAIALSLSAPVNLAPASPDAATVTIADDDPLPSVSMADAGAAEGGPLQFVLSRGGASELPLQVDYSVVPGTAGTPGDYDGSADPLAGTLVIPAAAASAVLTIATVEDGVYEAAEGLQVLLSAPVGATIADATAEGSIADDDPLPQFSVDSPAVAEGSDASVVFTVTRSGQTALASSVDYLVVPGSATTPEDYQPADALAGTLAFAPAAGSATVTLALVNDGVFEADEQFTLQLSNPVGASLAGAVGTASIADDDFAPGTLAFTAASFAAAEGDADNVVAVVQVERVGGSDGPAGVDCLVAAGGALPAAPGADFTPATVALSWADGEAGTRSCSVQLLGDVLDEDEETLALSLANASGATLGATVAALFTINDDDLPPTVGWTGDLAASEGDAGTTQFAFTASLSAPSGRSVSVDAATVDGTAVAGSDYSANAATLVFPPGSTSQPFPVDALGDTDDEGDQAFSVVLSAPVNAVLGTAAATATLLNDDAPPPMQGELRFVAASASAAESAATASIAVERINGSDGAVSVTCSAQPGSAGAGDFTAGSQLLAWADGEAGTRDCSVALLDDALDEDDETLSLVLSGPQGGAALAAPSTASLTLLDDEALPVLAIAPASVAEGDAGGTSLVFEVTLTPASGRAVSVQASTTAGSAAEGSDYTAASASLDFPAGTTLQVFAVEVLGDTEQEADETFSVGLQAAVNATLGTPGALGTVLDDDAPPPAPGSLRFTTASASVAEGDASAALAVERVDGSDGAVAVTCGTQAGSAGPADFVAGSQLLSWADGESGTRSCSVSLLDDAVDEDDETLSLVLSAPQGGAQLGVPATATVTLLDDEPLPALSIAPLALAEGDAGTTAFSFTVTLSAASGRTVSVTASTSDGSALAGSDYTAASASLTFAPGVTSQPFVVAVSGDAAEEGDESFTVTLGAPANASLDVLSASGTILDDDAPAAQQGALQFALANATVAEGTTATVLVRRSGGSDGAVSVAWTTADGSASAPADYAAGSGVLAWADGDGADKSFTVALADDAVVEGNETLQLLLSAPTGGAVLGTPASAVLTIADGTAVPTLQPQVIPSTGRLATLLLLAAFALAGMLALRRGPG